jgi:addiction module HigA family antidote
MKSKSSITTPKKKPELLSLITPGEILLEEFMKPLNLTANALALDLHVPANRIQAIVNGQRGITADTALRLSQHFGNSAEFWLNLQQNFELEKARRESLAEIQLKVTRRPTAKAIASPRNSEKRSVARPIIPWTTQPN